MIPSPPPPPTLTARQAEIAALVAEGLSSQAIADTLGISKRTVDAHLAKIGLLLPGSGRIRERLIRFVLVERAAAVGRRTAA